MNLTLYIIYIAHYCNFSMENKPYKAVYSLPEDEQKMFETCGRQEELN
jgi:hypothetical protein